MTEACSDHVKGFTSRLIAIFQFTNFLIRESLIKTIAVNLVNKGIQLREKK